MIIRQARVRYRLRFLSSWASKHEKEETALYVDGNQFFFIQKTLVPLDPKNNIATECQSSDAGNSFIYNAYHLLPIQALALNIDEDELSLLFKT